MPQYPIADPGRGQAQRLRLKLEQTPPEPTFAERRVQALDRLARIQCTTRLVAALGIDRELAALVLDDVLQTYQLITRRDRC